MKKSEAREIIKLALDAGKITFEVAAKANDAISAKTYCGIPMTSRDVESIIKNRFGL